MSRKLVFKEFEFNLKKYMWKRKEKNVMIQGQSFWSTVNKDWKRKKVGYSSNEIEPLNLPLVIV